MNVVASHHKDASESRSFCPEDMDSTPGERSAIQQSGDQFAQCRRHASILLHAAHLLVVEAFLLHPVPQHLLQVSMRLNLHLSGF